MDPNLETNAVDLKWAHENMWTCCSGTSIDKRGIIFIVQTFMVLIILIFCMYMICSAEDGEDYTVWVSIMSAIVGNFLPTGNPMNHQVPKPE